MMSSPDYILDLSAGGAPAPAVRSTVPAGRPWIAVRWRCCGAYSRIYRDPAAPSYQGRCPSCGRPVTLRVGPGGTSARFFEAG